MFFELGMPNTPARTRLYSIIDPEHFNQLVRTICCRVNNKLRALLLAG